MDNRGEIVFLPSYIIVLNLGSNKILNAYLLLLQLRVTNNIKS